MPWERIADVNLNRLNESLKFIEDVVRFSLENKTLLKKIRKIRNEFLRIKKSLPIKHIIDFRESGTDLGRTAAFDIQMKRIPEDLIIANLTRAKESSRILEEILKSTNVKTSKGMKEIRFHLYDLEKSVVGSLVRKFNPRVYAIIDEKYLSRYPIRDMVSILEKNGATMLQLRIKTLPDRSFYNIALRIKNAIQNSDIKFIINNRLDIALACRADGIHLGKDDMPVRMVREILGGTYIIGASASTIRDAESAQKDGADYIGVGALFKTRTKKDAIICRFSVFKSICKKITIPVVGIGGITNKNYRTVFAAGAAGIAVSSYLFEGDIKQNIRALTRKK